ncbi:MAG: hypothetical protein NC548_13265 [Lachnospiraceae bacterium]|nr:hypothetical protein [Lachnospiraceae bacterium]MCM1230640.1 hypothetical protein [Ruminococcus flavefaciens]
MSNSINLGKVALTPKGEWSSGTNYERLDVVSHNGSSYVCLRECSNVTPVEGEYWSLLAQRGADGEPGEPGEQGTEFGWLDASKLLVSSFNGRSGHIIPLAGDYTAEMVGAASRDHTHDLSGLAPVSHTHTLEELGAASVDHTHDQIVSMITRPNLLDNPNFAINQMEQNEYSGAGYTVDRWSIDVNNGDVRTIVEDGYIRVEVTRIDTSHAQSITQGIEVDKLPLGATVTFSAICRGVGQSTLLFYTSAEIDNISLPRYDLTEDFELHSLTFTIPNTLKNNGRFFIYADLTGNLGHIDIKAAKLEVGPNQTLAHREGNEWILNDPPPNRATELLKCQRYRYVVKGGFIRIRASLIINDRIDFFMPTPVPMRSRPSIKSNALKVSSLNSNEVVDGFTFVLSQVTSAGFVITANKKSHGLTDAVLLCSTDTDMTVFDANF